MPNYLGLADLVVLPLNDDLLAQTQMPCKVFEAMAMAKPIIASAVSDLPLVLEGCGWTVPPDDAGRLARCIQWAFTHPEEAASQGQRARQKCMAQYSRQVVSSQLHAIIGKLTNSL
jgi:glycosyltransferase involved in cell wall biosynthesis